MVFFFLLACFTALSSYLGQGAVADRRVVIRIGIIALLGIGIVLFDQQPGGFSPFEDGSELAGQMMSDLDTVHAPTPSVGVSG